MPVMAAIRSASGFLADDHSSNMPSNRVCSGVVVKYQALARELLDDDLVLDDDARRRIAALSRALRKIVPRAG